MRVQMLFGVFVVAAVGASAVAGPRVVITEIMYNPASEEGKNQSEWVEIANVGDEAIQLKGWRLARESKNSSGPINCTLASGGVAVLVNSAAVSEAEFRAAWDESPGPGAGSDKSPAYEVLPVKWVSLPNQVGPDTEGLQLIDDKGTRVCEAAYQTSSGWPSLSMSGGPSIWLTDVHATNLSQGSLWKASVVGEHGAHKCKATKVFNGSDIGSPGYVEADADKPGSKPMNPELPGGGAGKDPSPAPRPAAPKPVTPKPDVKKRDDDKVPY